MIYKNSLSDIITPKAGYKELMMPIKFSNETDEDKFILKGEVLGVEDNDTAPYTLGRLKSVEDLGRYPLFVALDNYNMINEDRGEEYQLIKVAVCSFRVNINDIKLPLLTEVMGKDIVNIRQVYDQILLSAIKSNVEVNGIEPTIPFEYEKQDIRDVYDLIYPQE